jgi:hypothetical protein
MLLIYSDIISLLRLGLRKEIQKSFYDAYMGTVLFRYPKCTPIPTNSRTRLTYMLWTQFGDNFWREARFSLDFKETVSREFVLSIYSLFPKSLVVAYCSFRTFPENCPNVWQYGGSPVTLARKASPVSRHQQGLPHKWQQRLADALFDSFSAPPVLLMLTCGVVSGEARLAMVVISRTHLTSVATLSRHWKIKVPRQVFGKTWN